MKWQVIILPVAERLLKEIKDNRIREQINKRIDRLEYTPEKQGKPLGDELEGLRSVRAVGQRYRIVYRIKAEQVVVLVVTVGIRKEKDKKDVYALTKKLAEQGLLDRE